MLILMNPTQKYISIYKQPHRKKLKFQLPLFGEFIYEYCSNPEAAYKGPSTRNLDCLNRVRNVFGLSSTQTRRIGSLNPQPFESGLQSG